VGSPVARILDGMVSAAFPFVISEPLLAEYRAVLVRPHLRKLHGLSIAETDILLTDIVQHAIVLSPAEGPAAPDRGDQLLWDLLAVRRDLILVTGDKALLRSVEMKTRVLLPSSFVERL
jgi:predicted nucleic acid-binding protein